MELELFQLRGLPDDGQNPKFHFGELSYPNFDHSNGILNWSEVYQGTHLATDLGKHLHWKILPGGGTSVPDFCEFFMGWVLMSEGIRHCISNFSKGAEYQWVEAEVEYACSSIPEKDYKWANFLTHQACLDFTRSIVQTDNGEIIDVKKPVINRSLVKVISGIFRLAEFPLLLLITGDLLRDFRMKGFTGFEAIPIELS